MRALLYTFVFLIVYGSLYPFIFDLDAYTSVKLSALLSFSPGNSRYGDTVANILLFLPFGFLAFKVFAAAGKPLIITLILLLGFLLAYLLQVAQLIIPGRAPSGVDALWNMLGCSLGMAFAKLPLDRYLPKFSGGHSLMPIPLVLALMWLAYNWVPFVVTLDIGLIHANLERMLSIDLRLWWLYQKVVMWLVIFHFLYEVQISHIREKIYPLLVFGVLAGSVFIVGHAISKEHILGGLLALPLWYLLRNRHRPPLLAVMLGLAILATTFTPFELRDFSRPFKWIPFSGALTNNLLLNSMATFKKLAVYGSFIWLLVEARISLRVATAVVAGILFGSELLQRYFVGPTPEITDPLLAVCIGIAFHIYQTSRQLQLNAAQAEHQEMYDNRPIAIDDNEKPGGNPASDPEPREPFVFNLRAFQESFMAIMHDRSGITPARLCEELIAIKIGHQPYESSLLASPEANSLPALGLEHRSKRWLRYEVSLAPPRVNDLQFLAKRAGKTPSNTLRHLIDKHIRKLEKKASPLTMAATFSRRRVRFIVKHRRISAAVACLVLLVSGFFILKDGVPTMVTSPGWAAHRAIIIFDGHSHTNFSDGRLTPAQLVESALEGGCDALAITDHSDVTDSGGERQLREIETLRALYPDFLLMTGIELNMPSYGSREHVNVIVGPRHEGRVLRNLGNLAEHSTNDPAGDAVLLNAISSYREQGVPMLTFYNHPSRKARKIEESMNDLLRWDPQGQIFTAVAGAPGHQNAKVIGSYVKPLLTEDRWDPVVSRVGGVWDQLLAQGYQLWGALASSDYHNPGMDKAPCSFSRIHVSAPDYSYRGLLHGIRTGTFWADHGRLLDSLRFSLEFDGLDTPAYPGSVVQLAADRVTAVASLSLERGPGGEGQPLSVEIISNCSTSQAEVVHQTTLGPGVDVDTGLIFASEDSNAHASCFVRARVRLHQAQEPDLLAYTNPVRILF